MGKIWPSIANLTSKCSAENLGPKVTTGNCRRGSFPRGHDQRSQFQIFFEHVLSGCFNVIGCLRNTLLSFALN